MDIQTRISESVLVVQLTGDLDSRTAVTVQDAVLPRVTDGNHLMIDLSAVPYMSSAGLRTLLLVYRQAQAQNGAIVLVGIAPEVRDVLSATGFLGAFLICETIEAGHKALAGSVTSQDGVA
jgi:anti-sigma B factor antagonist